MRSCSFLHIADLHLDSPFKGLRSTAPYIGERVRESTFDAMRKMVRLAIQLHVDFVIISGDTFDVADRSLRAQIRFQNALKELADHNIQTYIVHGNHDPENGRRAQLKWPDGVHFFASTHVETIDVSKPDRGIIAQVHGISYGNAVVKDNLALQFHRSAQAVYQVAILHANVDGDAEHEHYAPCSKQDLLQAGMDYWALGHVHTRKVIHEHPHIVYPGNTQGRSIRELGAKGCYHVQVDEQGKSTLTFHELDYVRWFLESMSIANLEDEQTLRDAMYVKMNEVRQQANGRDAIVRLKLEGRGSLHRSLQQTKFLDDLIAEWHDEELATVKRTKNASMSSSGRGVQLTFQLLDSNEYESEGIVWIESIENHTGNDLDMQLLLQEPSFIGDVLRTAQALRDDDSALDRLAQEMLATLKDLPPHLLNQMSSLAQLKLYLRAAEELAIDYLVKDGGEDE
jgi:exonuclease SbcD